jgi:rSAM/selenodomain-associated transferase 2
VTISMVVPVLEEAATIREFLAHVGERAPEAEVIVVDGGSTDGTRERARECGVRVIQAERSRARQMNAGARAAMGEILWFLHADSRLPPTPLAAIREAMADPGVAGGCFRLRVPRSEPLFRISDSLGNAGVDLFRIALGDHGIFCRRSAFEQVGGYPEVPLLEDAELYQALQRVGRVRQLRPPIETSPRRYDRNGPARTTALYALILALYAARVPIPALARLHARLR